MRPSIRLLSLIAAPLFLAPSLALAEPISRARRVSPPPQVHASTPVPPPGASAGRYELRNVDRWVDGRWQKEWVPGQCVTYKKHPHHKKTSCSPGQYVTRWVPGYRETVQQWVWVPAPVRVVPPPPRARVQLTMRF